MIRYRIFSDYKSSADHANEVCAMWNYDPHDFEEDMWFVSDDTYTHAVIINDCTPEILVAKDNVIWLSHEPSSIKRPDDAYIKNTASMIIGHGHGYDEGPTFLPAWVPPLEKPVVNKGKMSIILSHKSFLPGHRYRHSLVSEILKTDMDIHIYGNCNRIDDARYKGPIQYKEEGIHGYDYHIVIENENHEYWITEKLLDCYSAWSMPIYLGARFSSRAFRGALHLLSGNLSEDINLLKSIYESAPDLSLVGLARNEIWRKGGEYHYPSYLYNFARGNGWKA